MLSKECHTKKASVYVGRKEVELANLRLLNERRQKDKNKMKNTKDQPANTEIFQYNFNYQRSKKPILVKKSPIFEKKQEFRRNYML